MCKVCEHVYLPSGFQIRCGCTLGVPSGPSVPLASKTQPGSSDTLGLPQALGKGACPF